MSISDSISRLTAYYMRHGLGATIRRARLALKRALFANRMIVFYCDLSVQTSPAVTIPASFRVERLRNVAELSQQDWEALISLWNPKLARRNINERFAKGANLWVVRSGNRLAGYGWTLQGRSIEPYYFPLGPDDAHLFDFHVFPEYRGQGINPFLVGDILHTLATGCGGRAFIEAAEWNEAQLCSLRKTPFRRLGSARSMTVFGHKFTNWTARKGGEQVAQNVAQNEKSREKAPAIMSSHER